MHRKNNIVLTLKRTIASSLFVAHFVLTSCQPNSQSTSSMSNVDFTNDLIHESSPYLLQHAHNPVNWMPWGEKALQKAKDENKPLLISIGYSACHWCHVMEHESFEDTAVAKIMNEHFVCIKVDREERPDIDQVYMDAVQLMTGRGGWPLNCFALPDGRPFFGGTYFPKDQWVKVLTSVNETFISDPAKVNDYATKLTEGINQMDEMPVQPIPAEFSDEAVDAAVGRWKKQFDTAEGGAQGAPKFPLPNNYLFLLQYATTEDDAEVKKQVLLTLDKMAFGGIYDQVGGGFARYSTDDVWKAPHFEKMLYDNGQLLSLYSEAYKTTKKPLYKQVIEETSQFIKRELSAKDGAFYSALDADSEGEEGKFYVWSLEEIKDLSGDDFDLIKEYYNVNRNGLWEHGNYILLRDRSDSVIADKFSLSEDELHQKIELFKQKAMAVRGNRIRPGLDDKTLTSWNAMTSKGLVDAFIATNNEEHLLLAKGNLDFLLKQQVKKDGSLYHSYKNDKSSINAYLEDYAHLIDALIRYYEATFETAYLDKANSLAQYVVENFDRNDAGFFYFKSSADNRLIAQKAEITDNVIPASNSVFATCLFKLGQLYENEEFISITKSMAASVEPNFSRYPAGYSQWMSLMLYLSEPYYEIAIVGEECEEKRDALLQHYLPKALICGGKDAGKLPILQNRKVQGKTLIYVCQSGACKLPVSEIDAAMELID